MKKIAIVPLFLYILIVYNLLAFLGGDQVFNYIILQGQLISGAQFILTLDNLLVIIGLHILLIEIIRSTRATMSSVVNHMLSMSVFIFFLVEFLVVKKLGTASFFILGLMSMLDVVVGFTVSISTARRDISITQE